MEFDPYTAVLGAELHVIRRRDVLERDPPFDVQAALAEIRRAKGWGSGDLCFVLNVPRGTLASWEIRGSRPNVDDADAIRKLLQICRNCVTQDMN